MTQEDISGLVLFSIEHERAQQINVDKVNDIFVNMNQERISSNLK